MRKNEYIELLSLAKKRKLIEERNIIINCNDFNRILAKIHNKYCGGEKYVLADILDLPIPEYEMLKDKYVELLSKEIGKDIQASLLKSTLPFTCDCIMLEIK